MALEADFQHYYGLRLGHQLEAVDDAGWLFNLVKYLPPEAALWREKAQTQDTKPSEVEEEEYTDWKGRRVRRVNAQGLKQFLGGAGVGIGS